MPNDATQLNDSAENKAYQGMVRQSEANYVTLSPKPGVSACANCRWFHPSGDYMDSNPHCHIVENWPEPILATGYSNRWEAAPSMEREIEPIPVMIVEPDTSMDSAEMALPVPSTRRSMVDLIVQTVKGIVAPAAPTKPLETPQKAFTAWKGKDGQYFWLARHTGKWVDREDEIIADHAHEEFVQRVQSGAVPMPELWTWHKKGTAHGVADFVWKAGGFVCALGHFTGTQAQQERAAKWYNEHPDTKLSHMFKYPKNGKRGKVYHAYNTVEITTLPDGAEAFPYTAFEELTVMPFTKDQRDMIRGIGGDEMVTRAETLDAKALGDTAKNDAANIASKTNTPSSDNFEGSNIPGDAEEKVLLAAAKDFDMRLKTVEKLSETVTAQDTTIKALLSEVGTLKTQHTEAVTRANALEKQLAEYQAVQPPASKSDDTLLSQREASLLQTIANEAKTSDGLSLIEQAFGKQAAPAS